MKIRANNRKNQRKIKVGRAVPRAKKCGTLMVVDDDGSVRETLQTSLGRKYEVLGFDSGLELLDYMEIAEPDLIILDVCMPGMDGFSICRRIRSRKRFRRIPILFLTALKKDAEFVKGLESGCDSYMTKPFEMRELEEKIEYLLESSQEPPYVDAKN